MSKQVQIFLRTIFISLLTLGVHAQFVSTAQTHEITITTAKAIGEKIKLGIDAEGTVNIEGVTGSFVNEEILSYTLTKQTITIKGRVTALYCTANQITSLDVSKNTALTGLYCSANQLTSLDLSKNTALTYLSCGANQLTTLDVSKNTTLTELSCDQNQLTSLSLSKNTTLTELSCDQNRLTSLDLSKNVALTKLYCYSNQLVSLDLSKNTALTYLSCFSNQLVSLDLSKSIALTYLSCAMNQLTTLDVSKNIALTRLSCEQNQLTTLDVSKNIALTRLSCEQNQLTTLDVSQNTVLTLLNCHTNQIKDEAMTSLAKSLRSLPTSEKGEFCIINTKDDKEQNVCTKANIAIAKVKGWRITDFNGKWSDRKDYEGSEGNSVAAINSSSVQIYPNPVRDFVQIKGAKALSIVRIYSLDGRLVLTSRTDVDGTVGLDVSTLVMGEYLLSIGDKCSKLIIE